MISQVVKLYRWVNYLVVRKLSSTPNRYIRTMDIRVMVLADNRAKRREQDWMRPFGRFYSRKNERTVNKERKRRKKGTGASTNRHDTQYKTTHVYIGREREKRKSIIKPDDIT